MEHPKGNAPLLAGILVDVSGSMTSSIENKTGGSMNRLQSFQAALGDLAKRVEQAASSAGANEDPIQLFAYGFGFGNPLSFFFGGGGEKVRDLLQVPSAPSSVVGLRYLAKNWSTYKAHVESLAFQMFGETPMRLAFQIARERIARERNRIQASGAVLLVVSDGDPTDASPDQIKSEADALKAEGVTIVSCYITGADLTAPRHLYGHAGPEWNSGARLMFDCSSELPRDSEFHRYLLEHSWHIETGAKLFTQVNQSEVLAEFVGMLGSSQTISFQDQAAPPTPASNPKGLQGSTQAKKHVFLSYCHDNAAEVSQLRENLVAAGEAVWWDQDILGGQDWKLEIRKAMKNAYAIVLCLSKESQARSTSGIYPEALDAINMYREYSAGTIFLIPVRLSFCDIPPIEIDGTRMLDRLQHVDLFPLGKRASGLQTLLRAIRSSPNHP